MIKKKIKKYMSTILCGMLILSMATGCQSTSSNSSKEETLSASEKEIQALLASYEQDDKALSFDNTKWNYDEENDVYWQINVNYCANPATTDYETMGIYVPGDYMNAKKNEDGTYTCTVNNENKINGYSAETAPIVFPVNTAGYSAQQAPTSYSYSGLSEYMEAGYIYVYAGMRGRNNGYDDSKNLEYSGGAPWGVTDLKSAVRYYRYNSKSLPGNTDYIFTFGHSGGGAQSSLMGATGDSSLYFDYLTSIGSAMYDEDGNYISDAICGAMAWCPITSLDEADEAYEWNMGQYSDDGTRSDDTWTSALSDDLAEVYASFINDLNLKDENGNTLVLQKSNDGIYTSGSYYDYVLSTIETSLNNFLNDTSFPYTTSSSFMHDGGFAGGGANDGEKPSGDLPEGELPSGEAPSGNLPSGGTPPIGDSSSQESTTYETVQDYIDYLNQDGEWVTYDKETNTAKIKSVEDFVNNCKTATKDVGAFDSIDTSQAENALFGNDDSDSRHFDSIIQKLLEENKDEYSKYSDWDDSLIDEYAEDMSALDSLGNTTEYRQNMYNPMYYLSDYYDGYGTSNVAPFWRIRTGIEQGDTALTTEINLALALQNYNEVKDVDFATVWGQGHTTAERSGDSNTNFIEWVNDCVSQLK